MGIKELFHPQEQLLALDIGSGGIKMLQIDTTEGEPLLKSLSLASFQEEIFANNLISKQDLVTQAIQSLLETNGISDERAVISVPGPSALMKKIKISKMKLSQMKQQVFEEAGSFLPSGLENAKIDFHIIGEATDKVYNALVVAVKSDIVDSFVNPVARAGIETAVIDIDYFALANCFELNYPELKDQLVAIVDIGSRFSNVVLIKNEELLYAGDISLGGKAISDELLTKFSIEKSLINDYKHDPESIENQELKENIKNFLLSKSRNMSIEIKRQLSLFLNAAGIDGDVEKIMLTGGGSLIYGLIESLESTTNLECQILDPFKELTIDSSIDETMLSNLAPLFCTAVGLGLRQAGDRIVP